MGHDSEEKESLFDLDFLLKILNNVAKKSASFLRMLMNIKYFRCVHIRYLNVWETGVTPAL